MAGTIDIITRAFAGRRADGDILEFNPRPPEGIHRARFEVAHRRHRLQVDVLPDRLRVSAHPCSAPGVVVRVGEETRTIEGGELIEYRTATQA
jgi:trehalose/maltose hydrolase-like predicted phosphorylase